MDPTLKSDHRREGNVYQYEQQIQSTNPPVNTCREKIKTKYDYEL